MILYLLAVIYLGCGFVYVDLFLKELANEITVGNKHTMFFIQKNRKDKIIMISLIVIVWIFLAALRFYAVIKYSK